MTPTCFYALPAPVAAGTPAWYNGLWTSLHLTPTCQASKQDIATFAAARRAAVGRGNFRRNVRGMNTQRGTRTQNAAALSLSLCGSELYDGTVIGISVASSAFAADGAYYGMRDQVRAGASGGACCLMLQRLGRAPVQCCSWSSHTPTH